jgi:hypothetical protein
MVIISCQLLFIDFLAPFCHFLDPFVVFSKLKSFNMVQEFLMDCYDKSYFGYWETFGVLGHFQGLLVKSHFFNFAHVR